MFWSLLWPAADTLCRAATGQQPTLFDQIKDAEIATAAPFHRAFQQTGGLETHPLI
jgi:hypothetical protein